MKKVTRIMALLLILVIALSFSGCQALDELRASRATVSSDGTVTLPDGAAYMLLPECEEFVPDFTGSYSIYIADEELPLLLIPVAGTSASKSADGRFLRVFVGNEFRYYSRTDLYFQLRPRIYSGFSPDICCYSYYDTESRKTVLYTLTSEQAAAVEQVYTTQTPTVLPSAATLDYEHKADLYLYSEDYLFRQDTVDICVVEGEYFVVAYGNTLYSVPEELTPIFAQIMAKRVK